MSAPTEACPGCGRANVAWRVTCLYCGARMPNPAAPPPPKAVPDNLDALVREAMRGGSLDAVRRALADAGGAEVKPPAPPVAARPPDPKVRPSTPEPPPPIPFPARAAPLPEAGLAEALDQLVAAASAARAAAPPDRGAALDGVAAALDRARRLAVPPVVARPVVLPPIRHPFALVLDGLGDAEQAARLAPALEVDVATARTIAAVRHVHIALRGAEEAPLVRRAGAVNRDGVARASVVTRAALLEIPAAVVVVGRDTDGVWRIVDQPLWEDGVDPAQRPPGEAARGVEVFLALPGEVEVKAARGSPEANRWLRQGYTADPAATEHRVTVLDLHTPTQILRITPTCTHFGGLPGHDPTSTTRSFKRLVDALPDLFPGVRLESRKVCAATNASGDTRYTTGWPAWEEHTRAARLHARSGE